MSRRLLVSPITRRLVLGASLFIALIVSAPAEAHDHLVVGQTFLTPSLDPANRSAGWALASHSIAKNLFTVDREGRVAPLLGATPVIGLALSLGGIAATAHVAETLVSAATAQSHIRAAEALGGTPRHILVRHIFPEVMPALVLLQGYHAARGLLSWAALTFLGFGGDTSRPDWGGMVWEYRLFLFDHPLLPLIPAFAIGILAWSLARIGDPVQRASSLHA